MKTMEDQTGKNASSTGSVIDMRAKPKRPLSAYNIFYRLSRQLLISLMTKKDDPSTFVDYIFDSISSMDFGLLLEMSLQITRQYRNKIVDAGKEKMVNSLKPLGILGFKDLTRVIAAQWSKLAKSTKRVFESCSLEDKKVYNDLKNRWKSEKDAKIKRILDEQLLREDSAVHSSQDFEDVHTQFRSNISSPLSRNGKTFYRSSPSLCSTTMPTSVNDVIGLISLEQTRLYNKSLQIRCLQLNSCPSSSDVSYRTEGTKASGNYNSLNRPSCFNGTAAQVLSSQLHTNQLYSHQSHSSQVQPVEVKSSQVHRSQEHSSQAHTCREYVNQEYLSQEPFGDKYASIIGYSKVDRLQLLNKPKPIYEHWLLNNCMK